MIIRKELLKYFQVIYYYDLSLIIKINQDKVTRVSVFLQDDIQNMDGRIIIENKGYGNVGQSKPGAIK